MLTTFRKLFDLFEEKERWKVVGLLVMVVLTAFVQMVGVAALMPFMSLVANPELISKYPALEWFYDAFGFTSTNSFLFTVGVLVLGVIAFSNGFTALNNWMMIRFAWTNHHRISVRLLETYLHGPYTFYLAQNSSNLAKNVLAEVREVVVGVLTPLMIMVAKTFIAVFILALVFAVDPLLALTSALVLGGAYSLMYYIVRRQQTARGKMRVRMNGARFRAAGEALNGIKDVKVLGREREFLRRYSQPSKQYSALNASNALVTELPRYVLDTIAFGGIMVLVLYLLTTSDQIGEALSMITLYAVAGYRLMPALQGIFHSSGKIRFHHAALDSLHEHLVGNGSPADLLRGTMGVSREDLPGFEEEINIENLTFAYPNTESPVLTGISLRIPKNTTVGFVGSTGSGKTTLVDIILGLLLPQAGAVLVDGVALTERNLVSWRKRIGYVPQHIFLVDESVSSNIAFGLPPEEIDLEAVRRAAVLANIADFIEGLPLGYDTRVGDRGVRLSGGQRQRIGIARALYHNPEVLILDEATSALDGLTETAVMQAIRTLSGKKTIILIAHRLTTLADCDEIFLFAEGRLVDRGSYRELQTSSLTFQKMAQVGNMHAVAT